MASLTCPDCGTAIPWKSAGCAGCGVMFREIRCTGCKYVGTPDRFERRQCPRCSGDELEIVPCVGEGTDEVGDEAFVDGVPSADEIERSFARDRQKRAPEPAAAPPSSNPSKPPADKSLPGRKPPHSDSDSIADEPPSDAKGKPRESKERPNDARREKPKAPVARDPEPDSAPARRGDPEAPPVLKRRTWSTPKEEVAGKEEPPSEPPRVRSTKQEPVADRKKIRLTIDLSPKGRQIFLWAAVGVPILLLIVGIFYVVGSRPKPRIRHGAEMPVDAGALEAQAAALYNAAVQYYRSGQSEESLATLQQIVSKFPLTNAGGQARGALDRSARGLPPFEGIVAEPPPDQSPPTTQAPPVEPPPAEKKKVVIGIPTTPPTTGQTPPATSPDENLIVGTAPKLPGAPPQGSTLAKSEAKPRQLPPGFAAVESAGVHRSGWPIEVICLKDTSHMMLVPEGDFEMGNNAGESNAKPVHRVKLKVYYIDKFEITLLQYKHFLEQRRIEKNPYRDLSQAALAAVPSDKHPVVGVAWRDANTYADWSGKSLPTEAQWEKAARGTDGRLFPWGSGAPTWEKPRVPKQIDRVGSFSWDVSVYGCFDMAGNAWEWCADWYDPNFYHSSPTEDPDGPNSAPVPTVFKDFEKVIRGGSAAWDSTWRGFSGIHEEPVHVGFRCVLDIERLAPRATVVAPASNPPVSGRIPATAPKVPPGGYRF